MERHEPRTGRPRLGRIALVTTARRVVVHRPVGVAQVGELVGYQRAVSLVRAIGVATIFGFAPFFQLLHPGLVLTAGAAMTTSLVIHWWVLRQPHAVSGWQRIARVFVVLDSMAVYLGATAYAADASWLAYLFYPLLAFEAALTFGVRGVLVSLCVSVAVYGFQVAFRESLGFISELRTHVVVVLLFAVETLFLAMVARVSRRIRADLATLLEVSAVLARQESPERTLAALDSRLRTLVGARVRSVAIRGDAGRGYELVHVRRPFRARVEAEAVERASLLAGVDIEQRLLGGQMVTIRRIDANGEAVARELQMPPSARAFTLVPVHAEGAMIGVLPILWDVSRSPSHDEVDLLQGLADQAGLALLYAQLRDAHKRAAVDQLTGLANHGAFKQLLVRHVDRAQVAGAPLSLLFCDLDRFKVVNDSLGHSAGDDILRRVADAVSAEVRAQDVIARYGGDELAVLLPHVDRPAAMDVADRLLQVVRGLDRGWGLDLTIGVATFPDDATTADALLASADAAMYAGKREGRGRVVAARPGGRTVGDAAGAGGPPASAGVVEASRPG